jgi:SPP1 family predicted phage head-tail adaptor
MVNYTVNAGDLRTRVTFQVPTVITDAGGAQSVTYANVSTNPTVWARWIYAHGDEAVKSSAEKSTQRATVTVRFRADAVVTWRILMDGAPWQVLSVDHVRDRSQWTEMVVERVIGTV